MVSDPDRCLRDIAANGSFLRESAGTASTVVDTPSLFLLTDRQIKSAGTGTGEESLSIAINELAVSKRPDFPPVLFAWDVCDADIRAADYAYE